VTRVVNFGCLPRLPEGYSVIWHDGLEMYIGVGPDDYESAPTWNRFWVRRWTMEDAMSRTPVDVRREAIHSRAATRVAMKERRMQIKKRREILEEIAEMEQNKHLTKWPGALTMNLDFARDTFEKGGTVEQAEKYMARARKIYNDRPN
jgi:hypothetical protein